jgi:integrase-like protein
MAAFERWRNAFAKVCRRPLCGNTATRAIELNERRRKFPFIALGFQMRLVDQSFNFISVCVGTLANRGHDTRALQAYLGHRNIQHTVRYTELTPTRFKDFWRKADVTAGLIKRRF